MVTVEQVKELIAEQTETLAKLLFLELMLIVAFIAFVILIGYIVASVASHITFKEIKKQKTEKRGEIRTRNDKS